MSNKSLPAGYKLFPSGNGWGFSYCDYRGNQCRDGIVYGSEKDAIFMAQKTYETQQEYSQIQLFLKRAITTSSLVNVLDVLADICYDDPKLRWAVAGLEKVNPLAKESVL